MSVTGDVRANVPDLAIHAMCSRDRTLTIGHHLHELIFRCRCRSLGAIPYCLQPRVRQTVADSEPSSRCTGAQAPLPLSTIRVSTKPGAVHGSFLNGWHDRVRFFSGVLKSSHGPAVPREPTW